MTTLATITTLYDYHYWANAGLLRACEALKPEQWDLPLGPSWGSVHRLLVHMLDAERIWLARWQGDSPTALLKSEELPTLASVRQAWASIEAQLRAFVGQCDDARLDRDLSYANTKGVRYASPLVHLMLHLANHGTHHRGELAALLTLLEVPHPEDDLLYYLREQEASSR